MLEDREELDPQMSFLALDDDEGDGGKARKGNVKRGQKLNAVSLHQTLMLQLTSSADV